MHIVSVVLNVSDTPCLPACLRSLGATGYPGMEIIVVRNGPFREGFESEARLASDKVSEVIFTGLNGGYAAGNNAGIRRALEKGADYVLLLNDDTEVAPDFVEILAGAALKEPGAGVLGPRIFYFSEPEKVWFSGARFDRDQCSIFTPGTGLPAAVTAKGEVTETDYVTGCALFASRKMIEAVGLLDERFFLYWEDCDWGLRAAGAGFKSLVVPSAKVWHKISVSAGGEESPMKAYHKTRSHLLFADMHAPKAKKTLLLKLARDAAWLLFKSGAPGALRRAAAYLAGAAGYFAGSRGAGPDWLRGGGKGV